MNKVVQSTCKSYYERQIVYLFLLQLQDSVQDAVVTSVTSLQQQCQLAIISDPTLADSLNTTMVPDILSLTCPNDCNGQGTCMQGESVKNN